MSSLKVN